VWQRGQRWNGATSENVCKRDEQSPKTLGDELTTNCLQYTAARYGSYIITPLLRRVALRGTQQRASIISISGQTFEVICSKDGWNVFRIRIL
jgi:hypothetical protein